MRSDLGELYKHAQTIFAHADRRFFVSLQPLNNYFFLIKKML